MAETGTTGLGFQLVLRYFRKDDGHSWRKTNDVSIIKEAHEKLKGNKTTLSPCRETVVSNSCVNLSTLSSSNVDAELATSSSEYNIPLDLRPLWNN